MLKHRSMNRLLFPGLIACLSVAACNPPVAKQGAASTQVEAGAGSVRSFTIPDSSLQQISSPDTVFADGSRPSTWDIAGFSDPVAFKKFIALFKDWVAHDQADSVIAHVKFPLAHYKTAAELKAKYSEVFDSTMKAVVIQQPLNSIFRNYQGAMLGNGQLWWNELDGQYRIIAINK